MTAAGGASGATLREAGAADAAAIVALYAPYVRNTAVSFEEEVPSVEEMVTRIASSHVWLVAERPGGIVGYAYAAPFHRRSAYRWSVEVSVYLHADARGEGLGRRLVGEVLERATSRGFVNAFAGTTLPNPASVKLFESLGFAKIAHQHGVGFKLGRWHDVGWWQLQLRERSVPPPSLP